MSGPLVFFYLVERYTRCDLSVIQVCFATVLSNSFQRKAVVQYPDEERIAMIGDTGVKINDYVLVQMGIIVRTMSEDEAAVALKAWS